MIENIIMLSQCLRICGYFWMSHRDSVFFLTFLFVLVAELHLSLSTGFSLCFGLFDDLDVITFVITDLEHLFELSIRIIIGSCVS